jgi:membrane protein implicated in regulation of membrane protease activity
MAWWLWLLLGLALFGAEMATPGGFYALFFGVAALLVGALAGAQLIVSPAAQWLLFSLLSIASLLLFRRRLLAAFETPERRDAIDTLRGEVAVLGDEIAPGAIGRAELRGTSWTVRNMDDRPLRAGERCRVERTDGLTLLVRGEGS